ncbi:MAG: peptidoglycan-associated lipoprotein Pal [Candidatus Hydrogenedentes bacterium]|nr:peptidoglycan-associated lipoprotein Pal [Candidatus Hydrogenedentota bacterium]
MKHLRNGLLLATCLVMAVALSTGCKSKKQQPIQPDLAPATSSTAGAEDTTGTGLPDVDQESLIFTTPEGVRPIYFDYDSYTLRPDALETLSHNAEVLKGYPNVYVQIEGHCDERGTQDYNLALGEKRALATRDHLIRLGISGDRMITISYGEEDPADPGHSEDAWAKNRRCEFNKANK